MHLQLIRVQWRKHFTIKWTTSQIIASNKAFLMETAGNLKSELSITRVPLSEDAMETFRDVIAPRTDPS